MGKRLSIEDIPCLGKRRRKKIEELLRLEGPPWRKQDRWWLQVYDCRFRNFSAVTLCSTETNGSHKGSEKGVSSILEEVVSLATALASM